MNSFFLSSPFSTPRRYFAAVASPSPHPDSAFSSNSRDTIRQTVSSVTKQIRSPFEAGGKSDAFFHSTPSSSAFFSSLSSSQGKSRAKKRLSLDPVEPQTENVANGVIHSDHSNGSSRELLAEGHSAENSNEGKPARDAPLRGLNLDGLEIVKQKMLLARSLYGDASEYLKSQINQEGPILKKVGGVE